MKYAGEVAIAEPSAVRARVAGRGSYDNGAVFCRCPELGFTGSNLLYCRYGLSVPYLRVGKGWKVWIEPTRPDRERWIYSGLRDTGRESTSVDDAIEGALQTLSLTVVEDLQVAGNLQVDGNVVVQGMTTLMQELVTLKTIVASDDITSAKKIVAVSDVLAGAISLMAHMHTYTWTGGPAVTGPAQ